MWSMMPSCYSPSTRASPSLGLAAAVLAMRVRRRAQKFPSMSLSNVQFCHDFPCHGFIPDLRLFFSVNQGAFSSFGRPLHAEALLPDRSEPGALH